MNRDVFTGILALAVLVSVPGANLWAQGAPKSESGESDKSASKDDSGEKSESSDGESKESSGGAAEEGESSASSEGAGDGEASKERSDEEAEGGTKSEKGGKKKASKSGDSSGDKGTKEGPGGRKLRKNYPGTKSSKKGQMETDRIEGLKFKEGQSPGKAYDVKIQELETKIDDLKEKVFQSKSRVVLLKETVLGGNLSGSRAMIVHADELGSKFQLQRAMYSLDGNRVFNESVETGKLKKGKKKFRVYDGSISSGSHNVSILLEYRGSGFGVFNYMKGYDVRITSSCQFNVKPGKATILRVRTVKQGGAFERSIKEPGIKCEIEKTDLSKKTIKKKKKNRKNKKKKGGGSGGK